MISNSKQFILRNYQRETVDAGVGFLLSDSRENGLIVCPTGSGKSLIIASIVEAIDLPCLVFQPSKEILEQNYSKFVSIGRSPAIYSASVGEKRIGKITLATIGSVIRKPHLFKHVKYIIHDEAHFTNSKGGMYSDFYAAHPGVRVLGLTATPYRLSTDGFGGSILKFLTRTRPRVFTKVVHVVQNGDLFRDGYLANLEYKEVKTGFDKSMLRLNSTGADYTDESVKRHFATLNFSDQIVRCVNRLHELGRRGTLVFTRFVEEAQYVKSRIEGARIVTAESSKESREDALRDFRSGRCPVVCNVSCLTVGFDYPELANVIIARPTMSLALWYQMVGRCVRTHPSKENAFVVDMVGLTQQFGKVENLVLECGPHDTWFVSSNGVQLTNVYYGERKHFTPKSASM